MVLYNVTLNIQNEKYKSAGKNDIPFDFVLYPQSTKQFSDLSYECQKLGALISPLKKINSYSHRYSLTTDIY